MCSSPTAGAGLGKDTDNALLGKLLHQSKKEAKRKDGLPVTEFLRCEALMVQLHEVEARLKSEASEVQRLQHNVSITRKKEMKHERTYLINLITVRMQLVANLRLKGERVATG